MRRGRRRGMRRGRRRRRRGGPGCCGKGHVRNMRYINNDTQADKTFVPEESVRARFVARESTWGTSRPGGWSTIESNWSKRNTTNCSQYNQRTPCLALPSLGCRTLETTNQQAYGIHRCIPYKKQNLIQTFYHCHDRDIIVTHLGSLACHFGRPVSSMAVQEKTSGFQRFIHYTTRQQNTADQAAHPKVHTPYPSSHLPKNA
jgi:hypothetical protein